MNAAQQRKGGRMKIQTNLTVSPELKRLLSEAKVPSEEELREQRISFAYGNAMGIEGITKESVRWAAEHIRLAEAKG